MFQKSKTLALAALTALTFAGATLACTGSAEAHHFGPHWHWGPGFHHHHMFYPGPRIGIGLGYNVVQSDDDGPVCCRVARHNRFGQFVGFRRICTYN